MMRGPTILISHFRLHPSLGHGQASELCFHCYQTLHTFLWAPQAGVLEFTVKEERLFCSSKQGQIGSDLVLPLKTISGCLFRHQPLRLAY